MLYHLIDSIYIFVTSHPAPVESSSQVHTYISIKLNKLQVARKLKRLQV